MMNASIVDLRYKTKEVLRALERNEEVSLLYRGKLRGRIIPVGNRTSIRVKNHPYFGSEKTSEPVVEVMERLRGGRYG